MQVYGSVFIRIFPGQQPLAAPQLLSETGRTAATLSHSALKFTPRAFTRGTPHSALRIPHWNDCIARGKPVTRLHRCPSTTYPVTNRLHPSYTVTSLSINNLARTCHQRSAISHEPAPNPFLEGKARCAVPSCVRQ